MSDSKYSGISRTSISTSPCHLKETFRSLPWKDRVEVWNKMRRIPEERGCNARIRRWGKKKEERRVPSMGGKMWHQTQIDSAIVMWQTYPAHEATRAIPEDSFPQNSILSFICNWRRDGMACSEREIERWFVDWLFLQRLGRLRATRCAHGRKLNLQV